MASLILAGDIGGTKINLGLFQRAGGHLEIVREESFPTAGTASLEETVARFLAREEAEYGAAAFGVAGPVRENVAVLTNIPWSVNGPRLAVALGLARVEVVNDLVAMGYGVSALPPDRFAVLNEGRRDPSGNGALIAAGTGLGEAALLHDGSGWIPLASEGGHTSFAPENPLEDALLVYLREKLGGRVSFERVLSGPGLFNIYRFLRDTGRGEEFDWMTSRLDNEDPARLISELALADKSPLCVDALELFASIYGSEAGNLALTALATGGVYLGGGIAPKILPFLQRPAFLGAFFNRGRLSPLLRAMPVKVMLEPKAPLYGAAFLAEKTGMM
jgi:glucokinase